MVSVGAFSVGFAAVADVDGPTTVPPILTRMYQNCWTPVTPRVWSGRSVRWIGVPAIVKVVRRDRRQDRDGVARLEEAHLGHTGEVGAWYDVDRLRRARQGAGGVEVRGNTVSVAAFVSVGANSMIGVRRVAVVRLLQRLRPVVASGEGVERQGENLGERDLDGGDALDVVAADAQDLREAVVHVLRRRDSESWFLLKSRRPRARGVLRRKAVDDLTVGRRAVGPLRGEGGRGCRRAAWPGSSATSLTAWSAALAFGPTYEAEPHVAADVTGRLAPAIPAPARVARSVSF